MSIDEILAQCLADIERGATLDDCLARYPQAAGELQPLLLLALQLRAAPPPSLSEDAFARLAAGETVPFTGSAQNTKGEPRRIEGRAVPSDAQHGKIKVRVFVTPKIELIFNTTYHFQ